ncbi:TetR/AcrR family transcriptional regulator [Agreia sp. PsM10]|uniref:TetR/AcrR family transcriptional regulator n=1 Tax=Agreia sp. PsM10 TaxID=3030533 RepID=UPI00263AEDA4|nr:TetR/AcrR family transcriptional regulator [Agreia sp. PsM10]MDN4640162.1 TetR/AcrR family transcriptional regulator [Agreia sp. PsM10]
MTVQDPAPGSVRGQYANTEARRQQIIDATTLVFATKGYTGGSLRQVAKDLDLSITSVMHHFPSKVILLEAVLENADEGAREEFQSRTESEGLLGGIAWLAEYNLGHPELLRLLAVLGAEASTSGHAAHAWFHRRYVTLRSEMAAAVRRDQALGRTDSSVDPDMAAAAVIAVWDGLQLQWLTDPDVPFVPVLIKSVGVLLGGNEIASSHD